MSAATSSTAALFFVTGLAALLALMLVAVFRLPEWQPKTADGGTGPLLPPVPAQASAAQAAAFQASPGQASSGQASPGQASPGQDSLFQAASAGGPPRLPSRTAAASWPGPGPVARPGDVIPLGEPGQAADAGARPGDPGRQAQRDRDRMEQATVGRVVASGNPPWGPAPKPPGVP